MSRQYFRVGAKGQGKGNNPRRNQAANLAENETASFICFSQLLEEAPAALATEIIMEAGDQHDVVSETNPLEFLIGPPMMETHMEETAAFLQDGGQEAVGGEAYVTGITTREAVQQGKAVLDCGATRSIGSVTALEQLMAVNVAAYGESRVLHVDQNDRPVFGFGNSSTDRCTSTVKMGLQAGKRQGAIQVHALDKGDGPILLSIEAMTALGALVDFRSNLAVFRNLDPRKLVPLERSATGHILELLVRVASSMSNLTKQNLRKMIEQEGESAPRQWTRVELLQRIEEITGRDHTREKTKKQEEESEYRVLVRDLNHAARRKGDLQQFCVDRLGMQVNYNLTIAQLQKDAMAIIASRTPPEPADLVGFGRHASLSYGRLKSDHPEYCRWVKETASEGQCNPRLRRLAGWLLNDAKMVQEAQKEIRQPMKISDMKGETRGGYPTVMEPSTPRGSASTTKQ
ncbi:unnamed protein product, partial [Symbiodinium necroappetens]